MSQQITGRHHARIGSAQAGKARSRASLNMHTLGPGAQVLAEWSDRKLQLPDLEAIRKYRLAQVQRTLQRFDYAGIVLYDPVNIRYATDTTNMQVWIAHNANRYCYVGAEGPVILFDYEGIFHLSEHVDQIDEVRTAIPWLYMAAGPRYREIASRWAAEITDLVQHHSGNNRRLAIDRCNPEGIKALEDAGLSIHNGEEIMELARLVKHPEEIAAMRCAIAACEIALDEMRAALHPGISENRLWSVLHAENIAKGGEWIETRLLASGPRTNPWFQECSSRDIEAGDLVAFDTDLIGAFGICVDISRTWLCGDVAPRPEQRRLYRLAHEQILQNCALLKPGVSFYELTHDTLAYDRNQYNGYTVLFHGVGLADEYPGIYPPEQWESFGHDNVLQEGMVLCVESFVGEIGGREGVKLEEQVLITSAGHEMLSTYPFEEQLLRGKG